MLPSLASQLEAELADLRRTDSLRSLVPLDGAGRTEPTLAAACRLLSFCSNDYLGLSSDARLMAASSAAFSAAGFGASGSRLISGSFAEHHLLERDLATFLQLPAALVFPSGYQANLGVITALAGPEDLIVADRLVHASLIDAFRLSRAKLAVYRHLDLHQAAHHLGRLGHRYRRRLLVTESLFSMDGDIAPLPDLAKLAADHDAAFIVDEAHAFGTLGPAGRGLCAESNVQPDVLIATCGKALGSSGAFVAGSQNLCDLLVTKARSFIYTTAAPVPTAAATRAALAIASSPEGNALRLDLAGRSSQLRDALGLPQPALPTPIVPVLLGDNATALTVANALRDRGFFVQAIRPPTVPPGQARLRITLSARHTEDQVARLASALAETKAQHLGSQTTSPVVIAPKASAARQQRGLVLLGTDTGVGKTATACAVLYLLASRGLRPVPFKPVETGVADSPTDASALRNAANRLDLSLDIICPFRAPAPVAPAVAFPSGLAPSPAQLLQSAHSAASQGDFLLVETAGGLLSPYAEGFTAADLASNLQLPVLLVARNSLGTVNHTALAISEIRRRSLPLAGLLLVDTSASTSPDQATNATLIARQTGVVPLGTLPYVASREPDHLASALRNASTIDQLLDELLTVQLPRAWGK